MLRFSGLFSDIICCLAPRSPQKFLAQAELWSFKGDREEASGETSFFWGGVSKMGFCVGCSDGKTWTCLDDLLDVLI